MLYLFKSCWTSWCRKDGAELCLLPRDVFVEFNFLLASCKLKKSKHQRANFHSVSIWNGSTSLFLIWNHTRKCSGLLHPQQIHPRQQFLSSSKSTWPGLGTTMWIVSGLVFYEIHLTTNTGKWWQNQQLSTSCCF